MERTSAEIEEQSALAVEHNGKYPGMTYEEGVDAALRWVTGDSSDPPMEEE